MTLQEMKETLVRKTVVIDAHTHVGIAPKFYYQFGYPYALSLEDLAIRMAQLHIDYSVVFPFVDSAFYEIDPKSGQIRTTTRTCAFPYELENKNLLHEVYEIFPEYSRKFLPFLMFDPSREAEKQAEFFAALLEKYPVFGLKTATTYIQAFVTDLEGRGRPILELARRQNLPILFHSSVHPADPWASVYDIVDFAERYPDIRVCLAHSARFVEPVLKRANSLPNCYVDLSAFSIHCELVRQGSPSVAAQDVRFDADYADPLGAMRQLAQAFQNTMLWGSDTPFYYWIQKYTTADGSWQEDRLKCAFDQEARLVHKLPPEIRRKIAYENTLKFLFG